MSIRNATSPTAASAPPPPSTIGSAIFCFEGVARTSASIGTVAPLARATRVGGTASAAPITSVPASTARVAGIAEMAAANSRPNCAALW